MANDTSSIVDYETGHFTIDLLILSSRINCALGNISEALYTASQSKKIIKEGYQRSIHDANASFCLAEAFRDGDQVNEAEEYYNIAGSMFQSLIGEGNLIFAQFLASRGEFCRKIEEYDDAENLVNIAHNILLDVAPDRHIEYIGIFCSKSIIKYTRGDISGAEKLLSDLVIPYINAKIDIDHPTISFAKAFYGRILVETSSKTDMKELGSNLMQDNILFLRKECQFPDTHHMIVNILQSK